METVTGWTGETACALQAALRMSNETFARHLKVSPRTVDGWRKANKIPSVRIGGRRRFHLPSVWQALQATSEEQP